MDCVQEHSVQPLEAAVVDQVFLDESFFPQTLAERQPITTPLPQPLDLPVPHQQRDPSAISAKLTGEPQIESRTISRGDGHEPLRWVHIEAPNIETIDWLAQTFAVKPVDLLSASQPDRPAQSYRYGDYLVNSYAELGFDASEPFKITESRVLGILANDFLITIATGPSRSCQRIAREVADSSPASLEIGSSNHLFSRLLGSSLHMNEEAAFKLEEAAEKFSEIAAVDGPTPHHRAEYATLKRSVINSLRALQNNPEMIHSLREEDNLFGSPKPRTALERYEVIHSSTESRLRQAEQFLTLTQEDWRITQEEHQNNILFRLAVLTGALSPTALATGIFGMNFPDGLPYSTPTMVLGIGASISISAILVGTLLFNRAFPRQGKFIQKS